MKKYYIGLIVLAVLTVGLSIYVVSLGLSGKQDKETKDKAQEVVQLINAHVNRHNEVPASLQSVGATDVPSSITYNKISDERYEFCVTYKTASQGYNTSGLSTVLMNAAYGGSMGYDAGSEKFETEERSYLYLDYSHKKGKTCYTVKPYLTKQESSNNNTSDLMQQYCNPDSQYYQYYKQYCENQVQQD